MHGMPDPISEAALLKAFYAAFDRKDGEAMATAYAPNATFEDPAFGELHGEDVGAMWRMLCRNATDLEVGVRDIVVDGDRGSADWVATYTFTSTGRKVVNRVHAEFRFDDGLIADHRDSFSFWDWSRQALGPVAYAIGWNPIGPAVVRKRALGQLAAFRGAASPATE